MSRGRLLFPLTAVVARLDLATMAAASFDDEFQEVARVDTSGDGVGALDRRELAEVRFLAQVETDREEMTRMAVAGNVAESAIALVCHLATLERAGLYVSTTGVLGLKVGDRLVKLMNRRGTKVVQDLTRVPVYCTQVRHLNAWLGGESNLVHLQFEDRPQGTR
jgi:hypothetical protein